jgi:hypothetical protein
MSGKRFHRRMAQAHVHSGREERETFFQRKVRSRVEDIARILIDWRVLLIAGCLLLMLPLIFYFSSLDKTPVKVKKIRMGMTRAKPIPSVTRYKPEARHRVPEERRGIPEKRQPAVQAVRRPQADESERAPDAAPDRFEEPDANP